MKASKESIFLLVSLLIVIFVSVTIVLLLIQRDDQLYYETVSHVTEVLSNLREGGSLPDKIKDSWGREVCIIKGGAKIRIISQGSSTLTTNDDIYVNVNTQTWSHDIFFMYKDRCYMSGYSE